MGTNYLRNAWYAAAWQDEVGDKPLGRTFLDQPVVIYRTEAGETVALGDTCPHRYAPLHMGKVQGDAIACLYHGLRFGPDGACVHNPHGDIPRGAHVRSYTLAERYGLYWIWMGDKPADLEALPLAPELNLPGMVWVRGMLSVAGNYQLMIDNLLDLTHVEFMHPLLGRPGSAANTNYEARLENGVVHSIYDSPKVQPSLAVQMLWPDGPDVVHMRSPMRWTAPSNLVLYTVATHVGGDLDDAYLHMPTTHFLTPASATQTHYFWYAGRNRDIENEQLSQMTRMGIERTFMHEDEPMIAAIQSRMEAIDVSALPRLMFKTDAAAAQARRTLARLIEAEQAAA
jgi:vanillate O-demethylase monooxygenase subunit